MQRLILTDVHTHTTFSPDGRSDFAAMLERAQALGLSFWGISEHFDYDTFVDGVFYDGKPTPLIDAENYFFHARAAQEQTKTPRLLIGGEFGFSLNPKAYPFFQSVIETYSPDFIVNSVHTNGKFDYYEHEAFANQDQKTAYLEYLRRVRASLDVPYNYDIVGHLCYPCRNAPYPDRVLHYADFASELDDILSTIVQKDKILEVNSAVMGLDTPFLPFVEIVEKFFALGGRKISFASDAHDTKRLAENREKAVAVLKKIGFSYVTVPCRGKHLQIDI